MQQSQTESQKTPLRPGRLTRTKKTSAGSDSVGMQPGAPSQLPHPSPSSFSALDPRHINPGGQPFGGSNLDNSKFFVPSSQAPQNQFSQPSNIQNHLNLLGQLNPRYNPLQPQPIPSNPTLQPATQAPIPQFLSQAGGPPPVSSQPSTGAPPPQTVPPGPSPIPPRFQQTVPAPAPGAMNFPFSTFPQRDSSFSPMPSVYQNPMSGIFSSFFILIFSRWRRPRHASNLSPRNANDSRNPSESCTWDSKSAWHRDPTTPKPSWYSWDTKSASRWASSQSIRDSRHPKSAWWHS